MRSSIFLLLLFFSASAAFAADLRVRVVDPHSAAVAGAQVAIYRQGESVPLQVRSTLGDGEAVFPVGNGAALRAQVLAPGFAAAWVDVDPSSSSAVQVKLQVAAASETVVVIATRTPDTGTASQASTTPRAVRRSRMSCTTPISFSPSCPRMKPPYGRRLPPCPN